MSINLIYSSDRFQVFEHPTGAVDLFELTDREHCLFLDRHDGRELVSRVERTQETTVTTAGFVTSVDSYLAAYFQGDRS